MTAAECVPSFALISCIKCTMRHSNHCHVIRDRQYTRRDPTNSSTDISQRGRKKQPKWRRRQYLASCVSQPTVCVTTTWRFVGLAASLCWASDCLQHLGLRHQFRNLPTTLRNDAVTRGARRLMDRKRPSVSHSPSGHDFRSGI